MLNPWQYRHASQCIHRGGIIAYPTECVYGLGCDPSNPVAVERLLTLKNRPADKGLILIGAHMEHILPYIEPPSAEQQKRLQTTWPGPVTWLIKAQAQVPIWLKGEHDSIAVRLTAHPVAKQLCETAGQALISTSANKTGQSPAKSALKVRQYFGSQLDYILSGPLGNLSKPSIIKDLESGIIIRA